MTERGFSFADATKVFDDPFRFIEPAKVKDGEERSFILGKVAVGGKSLVMAVIYTERHLNGKEVVRIISALPANRKEARKLVREGTN